jgi:hypothetical protein
LMECHLLMRVCRFLEIDLLSLVRASIICKWWRAVFINFKKEMIQIDFSSLGSVCSDDIFRSLTVSGRKKELILMIFLSLNHILKISLTNFSEGYSKCLTGDFEGLHNSKSISCKRISAQTKVY